MSAVPVQQTKQETRQAISESQLWKKRLGDWVLNPYIGCAHGCFHCYCPSMPGVRTKNEGRSAAAWGDYVLEKRGFLDALKRQLRNFTPEKAKRTEWGDGWLLMSFLTDPYQPAEGKLKLTRECLKLLLEAGHKVRIQTRSALVARDFDLLMAYSDCVLLGTSLPYLDNDLARVLEPRASSPTRRLAMLESAASKGISVYVAVAPVMPWTSIDEFHTTLNTAAWIQPKQMFCEVLNPKGDNIERMLTALYDAKRTSEYEALKKYDAVKWSEATFIALAAGAAHFRGSTQFIPWPDTGREWKKHLTPENGKWLETYLPEGER